MPTVIERLDADPPPGLALQRHGEALRLVAAHGVGALRGAASSGARGHGVLSRAALEVLAMVACRRPATRAEIEALHGVNSDRALETLLGAPGRRGRAGATAWGRAGVARHRPRAFSTTWACAPSRRPPAAYQVLSRVLSTEC